MSNPYVDEHDGGYWVAGTDVSLDSIVYCFREGLSPETIVRDCFPALSLEQVYGAITHYLAHQSEIDTYLERSEQEEKAFGEEIRKRYPDIHRKLDELAKQLPLRRR